MPRAAFQSPRIGRYWSLAPPGVLQIFEQSLWRSGASQGGGRVANEYDEDFWELDPEKFDFGA
jgi:hypothetical protein